MTNKPQCRKRFAVFIVPEANPQYHLQSDLLELTGPHGERIFIPGSIMEHYGWRPLPENPKADVEGSPV